MPEFQLTLWAIGLLVWECYRPETPVRTLCRWTLAGVAAIFIFTFAKDILPDPSEWASFWGGLYQVDPLALFFKRFFLASVFMVVWMAGDSSLSLPVGRNEFMIMPLFTAVGMMLLASAADFTTVFVGLELVTISFYVLVAYQRNSPASLEAGVKYLVIGALSTGFLVYGIAFLFGTVGSTSFKQLEFHLAANPLNLGLLLAMLLIMAGAAFKVAAVPFHTWAPDVYQGAPTAVTGFLAVASKAAGVLVLLRVFAFAGFNNDRIEPYAASLMALLAGLSVIVGNLAALPQRNLKRLLGYSSIGHAGFILMALSALDYRGVEAVIIYLVVYYGAVFLALLLINALSAQLGGEDLSHYNGLAYRSPVLAFCLSVAFVSMAGIPPLAGFLGKMGVLAAVWNEGNYLLFILGLIGAAVGLYYYIGIVRAMYWNDVPAGESGAAKVCIPCSTLWLGVLLAAALVVFGLWMTPLQSLAGSVWSEGSAGVDWLTRR